VSVSVSTVYEECVSRLFTNMYNCQCKNYIISLNSCRCIIVRS
jgi:hypothetical protein